MHIIFHDGTGRYINSSTTGRDGSFTSTTGRDGTFLVSTTGLTGRYEYVFTAQESAMQEHSAALGTKAAVLQLIMYTISYIRTLSRVIHL